MYLFADVIDKANGSGELNVFIVEVTLISGIAEDIATAIKFNQAVYSLECLV